MIDLFPGEGQGQRLIPAIAQDVKTREVLMLAYMNAEALAKTIETGRAHYWSRSRKKLWLKGESSGTFRGSGRSGSTATRMQYFCSSTRRAEPATLATDPVSIEILRAMSWERRSSSPKTSTDETIISPL